MQLESYIFSSFPLLIFSPLVLALKILSHLPVAKCTTINTALLIIRKTVFNEIQTAFFFHRHGSRNYIHQEKKTYSIS